MTNEVTSTDLVAHCYSSFTSSQHEDKPKLFLEMKVLNLICLLIFITCVTACGANAKAYSAKEFNDVLDKAVSKLPIGSLPLPDIRQKFEGINGLVELSGSIQLTKGSLFSPHGLQRTGDCSVFNSVFLCELYVPDGAINYTGNGDYLYQAHLPSAYTWRVSGDINFNQASLNVNFGRYGMRGTWHREDGMSVGANVAVGPLHLGVDYQEKRGFDVSGNILIGKMGKVGANWNSKDKEFNVNGNVKVGPITAGANWNSRVKEVNVNVVGMNVATRDVGGSWRNTLGYSADILRKVDIMAADPVDLLEDSLELISGEHLQSILIKELSSLGK